MIAAAFGLAAAMETSGLAETIATGIVDVFGSWGDYGVLLGIVLATTLITNFISNAATVLLLFPIAMAAGTSLGLEPRGLGMAVALAAAVAFVTPIGYQTNIMVYGPGGYRFTDYLRLGLPLTALSIGMIVVLVPVFWPL
jgi:di/tricarboxylate transporter